MTFKNIKFYESPVMRELERQELRKNPPKPQPVIKQASAKLELDPNQEFFSQILSLGSLLRKKGFAKEADALDEKCFLLKQAETHLYRVFDQDGEDMLNFAHPEGDIMSFEAQQGLGKIETLQGVQKAMLDVVKKPATGKQTRSTSDAVVLAAMALGLIKTAQEADLPLPPGENTEEIGDYDKEKAAPINKSITDSFESIKQDLNKSLEIINSAKTDPLDINIMIKEKGNLVANLNVINNNDFNILWNYKNIIPDYSSVDNINKSLMTYTTYVNKSGADCIPQIDQVASIFEQFLPGTKSKIEAYKNKILNENQASLSNDQDDTGDRYKKNNAGDKMKQGFPSFIAPIAKAIADNLFAKYSDISNKLKVLSDKSNETKKAIASWINKCISDLNTKDLIISKIEDKEKNASLAIDRLGNVLKNIETANKWLASKDAANLDYLNFINGGEQAIIKRIQDSINPAQTKVPTAMNQISQVSFGKNNPAGEIITAGQLNSIRTILRNSLEKLTAEHERIQGLKISEENKNQLNEVVRTNMGIFRDFYSKLSGYDNKPFALLQKSVGNDIKSIQDLSTLVSERSKEVDEQIKLIRTKYAHISHKLEKTAFKLNKFSGFPPLQTLPGQTKTGPSDKGGGGGTSGGGKKNEKVVQMQTLLHSLGLSNIVKNPEHKVKLTRTGTHGSDSEFGDGVWGSYTEAALNVAKEYIPKGQTLIIKPTTNIDADAEKNIKILESIGLEGKAGEELDSIKIPEAGSPESFEEGPIKVFSTNLLTLYNMVSFLRKNNGFNFYPKNQTFYVKVKDIEASLNKFNIRWNEVSNSSKDDNKTLRYGNYLRELFTQYQSLLTKVANFNKTKEKNKFSKELKDATEVVVKVLEKKIYEQNGQPVQITPRYDYYGNDLDKNALFNYYNWTISLDKIKEFLGERDQIFNRYKAAIESISNPIDENTEIPISLLIDEASKVSKGRGPGGSTSPMNNLPGGQAGQGQGQGLGNPPANVNDPNAPPIGDSINVGINRFWQGKKTAQFGVKWINLDLMYQNFNDLAKSLFSNQSPDVFTAVINALEGNSISVNKAGQNSQWYNGVSWLPVFQMGRGGWEISPTLQTMYPTIQQVFYNLRDQNVNVKCRNFLLALQNDIPQVAQEWIAEIQQSGRASQEQLNREFSKLNRSVKSWTQIISNRLRDIGG